MMVDNPRNNDRNNEWFLPRSHANRIAEATNRAERFLFTEDASRLVGQFCRECSNLILDNRQFAIPPFNDTYVEYDPLFIRQVKNIVDPAERATHHGYLVTGNYIYYFASGFYSDLEAKIWTDETIISPTYFTFAPPGQEAFKDTRDTPFHDAAEDDRLAGFSIGLRAYNHSSTLNRKAISKEVQPHVFYEFKERMHTRLNAADASKAVGSALGSAAGTVLYLWAALLWLNRPTHTTFVEVPATRRISKGKLKAYAAHRIVEIDLRKARTVRAAFLSSIPRESPRRHKVRGTFCHKGGQVLGCSHVWPLLADEDGHWVCKACGRIRWWRKDHVAGDATKGWVDHEYAVTLEEKTT